MPRARRWLAGVRDRRAERVGGSRLHLAKRASRGERQAETRTAARRATDTNRRVVAFADAARDRQTETEARSRLARSRATHERLEDALLVFDRHAGARVVDVHDQLAFAVRRPPDQDLAARRRVLHRVVDHVRQRARHRIGVGDDLRAFGLPARRTAQIHAALARAWTDRADHMIDHGLQIGDRTGRVGWCPRHAPSAATRRPSVSGAGSDADTCAQTHPIPRASASCAASLRARRAITASGVRNSCEASPANVRAR